MRVEGVRFGRVGGNEVSDVMAGPAGENSGNKAPSGGEAAAVRLNEAREGAFFGNVIDGVTGGTGGLGNGGRSGGGGGGGHGFVLVGTLANSVVDNWVIAASGGTGGTGTPPGSGGEGGLAVGVVLSESSGNRVASNRLDGLTGGASGNQGQAAAGVAGVAFGVFLAPDALDNVVSDTNEVDGESVIYLHGEQDQVVQGYRLVGDTRPTNLGKIAVVECRNIVVRGNEVAGLVGPGGPSGGYHGAGGAGAEAVAILVRDSEGVAVEDNTVSGIRGGPGGMGGYERAGGRGGLVAAIRLDAVVGGRVEGNTVTDVTAGAGGAGAAGGPGGTAVGVHIVRSDGVTLLRNTLTGLAGGPSPPDQRPGSSGEAVGVLIEESDDVRASHLLVSQPRGALAYGVRLSGAGGRLDAATIFEPEGTSDAACVLVDAGSTLSVTGSILTSASHYGVRSADDNPADAVTVAWSDVWDNPAGDLDNVAVGEGVLSADPLFTSPRAEDFSLREDSPCVDAGDPDADCVAEPQAQDGSCRLDLGHLASSPQARSAP